MEIIKKYQEKKELRDSFNELAGKVFCLNFEDWYQNGFWTDNYIPYSVVIDGRIVANVSVNRCNMVHEGRKLKLIQLGTVMTDPDSRGKGYARLLMEEILRDYKDQVDGIYLFANDEVLDFYPKFGFKAKTEYQYSKSVSVDSEATVIRVPMNNEKDWDKMVQIINSKSQNGNFNMIDNAGLFMFYLSQFMQENVFYISDGDSYVVAELEEDTLSIHAIFGSAGIDDVVSAFGSGVKKLVLCFTPCDTSGYTEEEVHEEDTTLFVQGRAFDELEDHHFMFQSISHA